MTYRTHVATTTAIALPLLVLGNMLNVFIMIGILIGSVAPDIDSPRSYISKYIPVIPSLINKKFGHRGVIHSLMATGVIGVVFLLIWGLDIIGIIHTLIPAMILGGVTFGFLLHLCEDGLSVSGIKWFAPYNKKAYPISENSIFKFLKYKTIGFGKGYSKENVYLFIALIAIVVEIFLFKGMISNQIKYMAMNGVHSITDITRHYRRDSYYSSNYNNNY